MIQVLKVVIVFYLIVGVYACDFIKESDKSVSLPSNEAARVDKKTFIRQKDVGSLSGKKGISSLEVEIENDLFEAQMFAVLNERVQKNFYLDSSKSQAIRAEVMSVRRTLPSDLTVASKACHSSQCARVNIYNFYTNSTTSVIVDMLEQQVLSMSTLPETQPDISQPLIDVAISIAKASPLARKALHKELAGTKGITSVDNIQPVMAEIKSALRDTLCERSQHLCVAPTYVVGDKALWVIVDLTDFHVVGVRWTELQQSGPPTIVTERILENEVVFEHYCKQDNKIEKNGWSFDYRLTGSDGLEVKNLSYKGEHVIQSAKLVDWHVSYSTKDNFGYSDAAGCPLFSSAVIVAYDAPKVEVIKKEGEVLGFALIQDFRQHPWPAPCNYRYEQRFEFYNDGRFRPAFANHGRGCGDNGTYRPILRVQLDEVNTVKPYSIQAQTENGWQTLDKETWSAASNEELQKKPHSHRIVKSGGSSYLIEPSHGQFVDQGRGDNPFFYVSVVQEEQDEGQSDLITLGSCCNQDYRQGPEQFISPEQDTKGQPLAYWYVAQLENDGDDNEKYCWADTLIEQGVKSTKTWPCYGGPMFLPTQAVSH